MLQGEVKPIAAYEEDEICAMYRLMAEFYDDMSEDAFRRDFRQKDYCLLLRHETDGVVGFTTQKVMTFPLGGREITGIFSGDTIIHKRHWGDMQLFRTWARFWFAYAARYDEFYWFLICKGYKTYCMLPLFFTEFYPDRRRPTPPYERRIIDTYAAALYGDEYNPATGVIEYRRVKDKLKKGVADIGSRELKNKDIAFFTRANPGYADGNDLACLARLDRSALKKRAEKILFS